MIAPIVLAFALLMAGGAAAQPLAPAPAAPNARIAERLDAALPLDIPLRDARARAVRLGDFFDGRPVILVLGYYRCPQLCGLLMHGVLEALNAAALGAREIRVVGISIDPQDTPTNAAARLRLDMSYARFLEQSRPAAGLPDLELLVGAAPDIAVLAGRAGFVFEPRAADDDPADPQRFAHAAGIFVVAPQGRVAGVLPGVRFGPAALRRAVTAAAQRRPIESSSGLALLCAHIDLRLGRHSQAVMNGIRTLGGLAAAVLATGWWLRRRRGRSVPK